MSHDAHTFNACGEMVARLPHVEAGTATCRQTVPDAVASQSLISHRLVAEDLCIHEIGRSATRR